MWVGGCVGAGAGKGDGEVSERGCMGLNSACGGVEKNATRYNMHRIVLTNLLSARARKAMSGLP